MRQRSWLGKSWAGLKKQKRTRLVLISTRSPVKQTWTRLVLTASQLPMKQKRTRVVLISTKSVVKQKNTRLVLMSTESSVKSHGTMWSNLLSRSNTVALLGPTLCGLTAVHAALCAWSKKLIVHAHCMVDVHA